MIKKIENHIDCTGCSACYSVCPKNAIEMCSDEFGFVLPVIDESKCINCMLCDKTCPKYDELVHAGRIETWYGWNIDEHIRKNSSSGGAFSALAQSIIDNGGVVFGAAFDPKTNKVNMVSSEDDLSLIRKSKYVDSFVADSFIHVKELLKNGRQVLYCGTPCQIAGLKKFIGENENLLLVDFLCHGVSSSKILDEHLSFLSRKYNSKIVNVDFRPKSMGWSDHAIRVNFENGKVYDKYCMLDPYFYGDMVADIMLKDSCYSCKYTEKHCSDITIGDFWGVVNYDNSINDNKGISLIEANNEKGVDAIAEAKEYLFLDSLDKKYADYAYFKLSRDGFESKIQRKTDFLNLCKDVGFEKAAELTYMTNMTKVKFKVIVKKFMRKLGIRK